MELSSRLSPGYQLTSDHSTPQLPCMEGCGGQVSLQVPGDSSSYTLEEILKLECRTSHSHSVWLCWAVVFVVILSGAWSSLLIWSIPKTG